MNTTKHTYTLVMVVVPVLLGIATLAAWVVCTGCASHLWHMPMIGAMCALLAWTFHTERDKF